jgi:hypothetical protein
VAAKLSRTIKLEPKRVRLSDLHYQRREVCHNLLAHFESELRYALKGEKTNESFPKTGLILPGRISRRDVVKDASEILTELTIKQTKGGDLRFALFRWRLVKGKVTVTLRVPFHVTMAIITEEEAAQLGPCCLRGQKLQSGFRGPVGGGGLDEKGLSLVARVIARCFARRKIAYAHPWCHEG